MPVFKFAVTETRNVEMHYLVEADTEEDARIMAEAGDTIEEHEVQFTGVTDRYVGELLSQTDGE